MIWNSTISALPDEITIMQVFKVKRNGGDAFMRVFVRVCVLCVCVLYVFGFLFAYYKYFYPHKRKAE